MVPELIKAVSIGTVLMLGILMICRRWYLFPLWKTIATAPILTLCGVLGVKVLFFIENGTWKGLSFYGAVLLIPILFLIVARLIKLPYSQLLDNCAPAVCVMLAWMKVECVTTGCCKGRVLFENAAGEAVRFPSQITELVNALVIMVILMLIMRKPKHRGKIYPLFMVIYGGTRFIWNLFRETNPFIWILPAGNFWSLISIAVGLVWLLVLRKKEENTIL